MEVTVLGCGAAYPRAGGACSGFLVSGGGVRVWMDAGNGTMSNLQRWISHRDVDALILSHVHADHISDAIPYMYSLAFDEGWTGTVPVYTTAEVPVTLARPLGDHSRGLFKRVLDFHELGSPFEVGGLRFEPFETVHTVKTFGLRVREADKLLVYTADTTEFPELPEECRGADLLIAEATYVRPIQAAPGVHMWAHQAGAVAQKAEARRTVLTHIWPTIDPAVSVAEASEEFSGPVEAALEGRTYKL